MAPDNKRAGSNLKGKNHRNLQASGLYQHISPPRAVPALKPSTVRQWLAAGDVAKLEQLVTDGQGHRLLGEHASLHASKQFMRNLPGLMSRQEAVHAAADSGRAEDVRIMVEKGEEGARLAVSKDAAGLGLLHKAVLRGHEELAQILIDKFPALVHLRDHEGRTPLHYCGSGPDPMTMWSILEAAGADKDVVDRRGNRARNYMGIKPTSTGTQGSNVATSISSGDLPAVVTRAHIRKWIHERDLPRLEHLVWCGLGERLLPETSTTPRVRRFLEAVPSILSIIKEVHFAVVNNNLPLWHMRTSPPAPTHLVLSQDKNGLTPLHKAAGLGHSEIADDIIQRTSVSAVMRDAEKRLPLHYAAIHQATSPIYKLLLAAGADENIPDMRGRAATYYAQHPGDLHNTAALHSTPEAPRAPTQLPPGWNWGMLTLEPEALITRPGGYFNLGPARISLPNLPRPGISSFNPPFRTGNPSNNKSLQNGYLHNRSGNITLPRPNLFNKNPSPPKTSSNTQAKIISPTKPTSNNLPVKPAPNLPVKPTSTLPVKPASTLPGPILPVKPISNPEPPVDTEPIQDQPEIPKTEPEPNLAPIEDVIMKSRSTLSTAIAAVTKSRKNNATPLSLAVAALTQKKTTLNSSTPATTFSFSPNVSSRSPLRQTDSLSKTYPMLTPHSAPDYAGIRIGGNNEYSVPSTAPAPGQNKTTTMQNNILGNGKTSSEDDLLFGPPIRPITPPGVRMAAPVLERWVRAGNLARLEDALLEGRGHRVMKLLASAAQTHDFREFIDRAPGFMDAMRNMHATTAAGNVTEVRGLIAQYRRMVLARDDEGMQPMHVAARAGHEDMLRLLLRVFPRGAGVTDWEGRTPLHYAGMCQDAERALTCYQLLLAYAAPESAKDATGNRASDYLAEPRGTVDVTSSPYDVPNKVNEATIEPPPVSDIPVENNQPINTNPSRQMNDLNNLSNFNGPTQVSTPPSQLNIPTKVQEPAKTEPPVEEPKNVVEKPKISAPIEVQPALTEVEPPRKITTNPPPKQEALEPAVIDISNKQAEKNTTFDGTETLISEAMKPLPNYQNEQYDPAREEARRLVEARNTEKLAELVLAGHGDKIIGLRSSNAYVQGLIDHVPIYMEKISAVHLAASHGDLAALQTALERRKFVTSRDQYGATPLHKAVLFRQVGVARYLGGRFPETLDAQDNAGRTPLHYAAVLPDRGLIYRSLIALGADPRKRDKRGHTALDYQLHHEQRRDHENLLIELGEDPAMAARPLDPAQAAAVAAAAASTLDLLQQPPEAESSTMQNSDYVEKSVGEPLMQGLKEVSSFRPKDPIAFLANYLYNFPHVTRQVQVGTQKLTDARTGLHAGIEGETQDNKPGTRGRTPESRLQTAGSMTNAAGSTNRDEHGQSMLHFAAARSHSRNAFAQLLREAGLSVGQRDALYRTPRDVAIEAGLPENARDIDAWVLHIALEGDTAKLEELLMDGYDHILDVKDSNGATIMELVQQSNVQESTALLKAIPAFENKRDWLHKAIRHGSLESVQEVMSSQRLAVARNLKGRCSLHVAALCQQEHILEFIATTFPLTLSAGDNLERTALHYAMAMDKAEVLSMALVKAGAKRVLKDLKGRQASFYFVNRSDIIKLSEEEIQEKNNS